MEIQNTAFEGLFIIKPIPLGDERGWFMRTYDIELFKKNIPSFSGEWKQMNHSFNAKKNTFRGLHFQRPPFMESKCIRCISGAVIDFALDLRKDSDTFLQVFEIELSAKNRKMIYIPKGFAHGFLTLEDNSELVYLHDEFYHSDYDSGVFYGDEMIINPINITPEIISEKDKNYSRLDVNFKGI
ncbi:MAG: dTDP-4-dehydrorhamnose 3,5-epimerase family protein [Chitinophagales bacterium]|jgi:dTDP-4-dehydrorhamnose 3,5-epimerase|nr:dTDP-4-dehydrorhamnose 3,5-epimerase family protein [Chitinophagales bacterium]